MGQIPHDLGRSPSGVAPAHDGDVEVRFITVPRPTSEHYGCDHTYLIVDLRGDHGHLRTAAEGAIWCQTDSRPAAKHIAEALNRFPPDDPDPDEEPF